MTQLHPVTIHLSPEQQEQIVLLATLAAILVLVGLAVIVHLAAKLDRLERASTDLRHRLLTAESIGQTQAVALQTVDALARASQRSRS